VTGGSSGLLSGRRILLGVTGGIAAYKAAYLVRLLTAAGADVEVVMTSAALRFIGADTFSALTHRPVHSDLFEQSEAVLHVRLAHEADAAVVAPATANVLAKLTLGMADDLLTSTLLEATCPLVLAPAMHTGMWEQPATQSNLATLAERGATIVPPGVGPLAAGDQGPGRMAEPESIVSALVERLSAGRYLDGRKILVTAGPTHEPIDAVRFIGNRSSGKMGFAIAAEASRRGAEVTLVAGPVALADPPGTEVIRVETAEEMAGEVLGRYRDVDAVVMAAAVADFRPDRPIEGKVKKDAGPLALKLDRTVDILATLGKQKEGQVLVGFAAETENPIAEGRRKLTEKNLDLLVANEVGRPGTGFDSETNRAAILAATGDDADLREWNKEELARAIIDRLVGLLPSGRA
jgi:phosphopantothenoylcysteine decarboxylase / phosphopantothenate---cysteine ligase